MCIRDSAGAEGKVIISAGRFNLDQRHYIWIEGFCFEGYTLTNEVINLNKGLSLIHISLIGVNVTIKNEPGLGTITDINGKFTI